ncbi:CapA family protein [Lentibacillus cibarius]|uniref:CapA family protein n=1 Tax=Lentibacillus cibarius TaxID=2583219 RepID=A0A5S3QKT8_9BACI|nr:CapA family protein [Lentibacillus cibarius]TMN22550.1 CapA family protein [Lentibacillus cibarius]
MKWGQSVWILVVLAACLVLTACTGNEPEQSDNPVKKPEKEKRQKSKVIHQEITLSAVGDILIHDTVYEDGRTANGGYDFKPMLKRVKPYLNDTTITFANQETMIGGEVLGLSSYPTFNSPYAVGDALKDAGVDVVSMANNHTLDGGEEAIMNAIEHWENIDMMYTGAYKDEADREQIRVYKTEEGISVAFLAYTYGTNGIPVPGGKDYLVNLIDKQHMASRIKEAKHQADAVVLSLHYGNEYERMPSKEQQELVQFAADNGVQVVLGHHPHVLQPVDWVEGENGNRTLAIYSLGNFLSGQDEFYRRIGGIFKFSIDKTMKDEKETIQIKAPKFIPTFVKVHNWANYEVAPMYQLTNDELANAEKHYREIKHHMSQWVPELEFIEE